MPDKEYKPDRKKMKLLRPLKTGDVDYMKWIGKAPRQRVPVWNAWVELGYDASRREILNRAKVNDDTLHRRTLKKGIDQIKEMGIWDRKPGLGNYVYASYAESDGYRYHHLLHIGATECVPVFPEGERPRGPPRVSFYGGIYPEEFDDTFREIVKDIEKSLDRLSDWWVDRYSIPPPETREQSTVGVLFPYLVAYLGRYPPEHIPGTP
ncbi:MAG: hypothetical protein LN417_04220 [Candidatus Thermoplasmatota archaeon]|nr:hypothetical protein [Candidatus Thermoplasmatota archaeon]